LNIGKFLIKISCFLFIYNLIEMFDNFIKKRERIKGSLSGIKKKEVMNIFDVFYGSLIGYMK